MYNKGGDSMKRFCEVCVYETIKSTTVKYDKGSYIFHEGDPLTDIYMVKTGFIKVSRLYPSGEEKVFDIVGPHDFLALLLVLQEKDIYQASAYALTDVVLNKSSKKDALVAYNSNKTFKDACIDCASMRANIFQNQLFQVANTSTDEKILGVLGHLYQKFGSYKNNQHQLYLPITKTDLANIIGIRRETLSRKLSELQKNGVIKITKNLYIFNRM
jgi:CRP/FNR family transcriptional regulator